MSKGHPEPLSSRSILREEAQKLLEEAVRMAEPTTRKHLLARSFELLQRAEAEASAHETPAPG